MATIRLLYGYNALLGKPGQSKKEIQDQSQPTQSCLGCLSFIFPIPLLFFYLYYKKTRKNVQITPPNCKKCGHVMAQAPKEEQEAALTKNQQIENMLQAFDYSLWTCPECGEKELLQHKGSNYKKFDTCPNCQAHALKRTDYKVQSLATYEHEGKQLNSYVCQACGHNMQKLVVLPKKVRSSSSYSSSGSRGSYRSSSRSSSSGGSWGGGHSSGGGAGRRF